MARTLPRSRTASFLFTRADDELNAACLVQRRMREETRGSKTYDESLNHLFRCTSSARPAVAPYHYLSSCTIKLKKLFCGSVVASAILPAKSLALRDRFRTIRVWAGSDVFHEKGQAPIRAIVSTMNFQSGICAATSRTVARF